MNNTRGRSSPRGAGAAAIGSATATSVVDAPVRPDGNEQALVARLKAGHRDAFREAVTRHSPHMLATARSIVGPAYAEDIVQDAWLTVLSEIGGFEERATLGTWLTRIVANRAVSHLRSRAREAGGPPRDTSEPETDWFDDSGRWRTPPPSWGGGSPEDLLSADALQECIDKHLQLMPEQQRAVLVLRDIRQHSYDDICTDLGVSASNVRVLLHRGRMKLMNMVNRFQSTGTC